MNEALLELLPRTIHNGNYTDQSWNLSRPQDLKQPKIQGRVIWKPINTSPGYKAKQKLHFFLLKNVFHCWIIWDYSNSILKENQYQQKTSPKSLRTEIKILSNPGLAKPGFKQNWPSTLAIDHCHSHRNSQQKTDSNLQLRPTLWGNFMTSWLQELTLHAIPCTDQC